MSINAHRRLSALLIATVAALTVAATLALSATGAGARPLATIRSATTALSAEQDVLRRINDTRAAAGVAPLVADGYLDAYARQHVTAVAQAGRLFHSDLNTWLLGPYGAVAENVGYANDAAAAHAMFVASAFHYENMVNPGYHRVGIGLLAGGPWMFAVYVFAA